MTTAMATDVINVEICSGTTCFLLGSSDLFELTKHLPTYLKNSVSVNAVHCLGECTCGNFSSAPFVKVDGDIVENASVENIIDRIIDRY